ncbi:MAG: ATP-binding protein [Bacteroidetes bacterium]|nr:ATP-binding protein [Bacteroidota bacterium]MDA0875654.1 ATP-binding protein [Bacteroidota bacterium]
MEVTRQQFHKLDAVIDELHGLFELWEREDALLSHLDSDTIQLFRLAVHEWVANLVQHADFGDREPDIVMDVIPNGRRVRCIIEDNSEGFPFPEQIDVQRNALTPFPERGMGLLMLNAATEYFEYSQTREGRRRLEFTVSGEADSCLDIPFS